MKIFLDTGSLEEIKKYKDKVDGFTTNPSLMKKAGVTNYEKFAKEVLSITDKPVSLEVLSDDFKEMERQAKKLASWGDNVWVKIPITNTKGESSASLIASLDCNINVTGVLTVMQVLKILSSKDMIVSVFVGRIEDTGKSVLGPPLSSLGHVRFLWASTREVYNIHEAEKLGWDIITVPPDILEKYWLRKGQDLEELSLETIKQFYEDGKGYIL